MTCGESTDRSRAAITIEVAPGLHVTTLSRANLTELFITALPDGGGFRSMFENVFHAVREHEATILSKDVFGVPAVTKEGIEALYDVWGDVTWPVTWLDEGDSAGAALTGVTARAVTDVDVERIVLDGRTVGSVFDDGAARRCVLGDLRPTDTSLPRRDQATATFDMMERALVMVDMAFSDVVRTWLYLDHLLEWYDLLNDVRNEFYRQRGLFDRVVPVSTGVGGANAAGAAIIADACAIRPHGDDIKITPLPSPLQGSALEYGSSFSRAIEIDAGDHRRVLVSGTACIDPAGATAYVGDEARQIDQTMRVVAAILESRGMDWSNVTRAIAYIKDGTKAHQFADYLTANDLTDMPVVTTENDVCRDDLLFEIEADAIDIN